MSQRMPEKPDLPEPFNRSYSPLLTGIGCVSALVILGFFVAGIGLMFSSFFSLPDSGSSTFLWGALCLLLGSFLGVLVERIAKIAGIPPYELGMMTLAPVMSMAEYLANKRGTSFQQLDNRGARTSHETPTRIWARVSTHYVQANDNERLPASENNKED